MKPLIAACCLVLLTVVSTQTVYADIAKPPKPGDKPGKVVLRTGLEIVPDAKAYEARLQISESDFKSLRASLEGTPGNTSIAASIAQSSMRTIIAGLLMFLSISIAGVLFARSSFGRTQKTVAGLILVVAVLGAAAIITRGNAGPPDSYRWRNLPQALAEGKPTLGGVNIEIVPDGNSGNIMRLIIPLKKQNSPGE
jgi:ABC-type transport system involved in cytochrome c biogenesis permease subunit